MDKSVLVVIPTYNESRTIAMVIDRTLATVPEAHLLIVDDGSPDGTGTIVEDRRLGDDRIDVLHRPRKLGLGRAYIAGFTWGLDRDFSLFVEMDADLSHDPGVIPQFISAMEVGDLAIGSRYVPGGGVVGWSPARLRLSKAGNLYARAALGFGIRDSTSGFRCFRRQVLEEIGLDNVKADGYAFQIDMAYRAWKLGFRIKEIPITFAERAAGSSKMSRTIVAEAIALVTGWGLRDMFRRKRRHSAPEGPAGAGEGISSH
jgi:dolichol-phosphate mannosyltransferase